MTAVCPYCAAPLPKIPARKTKCKACSQFMYVKSTPDNREKRLMTEVQAEAAEQLWSKHYEPHASVAALKPALMILAYDTKADRQQRKLAALNLVRLAETHEERESWSVLVYALELEMLAAGGGVPQVMIRGEAARCTVCARMDQRLMNIERAMAEMPLPPRDCPVLMEGNACMCWYRAVIPGWGKA